MFEKFTEKRVKTTGAEIFTLIGGRGPPLLLLHGYPQNHVMWHNVAPELAKTFSLVIPNLRGYGESKGPAPDPAHVNYSKRVMAEDMIELMASLGHKRFSIAGHDRGGRVAYRLALDAPQHVERLALLNIIPTLEVWEQIKGPDAARQYFNWLLLAQPAPIPERIVGANIEFMLKHIFDEWAGESNVLDPAAVANYIRHFSKASVLQAACEDYRAGASVDLEHDRADRNAGRRIKCPTLILWGQRDLIAANGSPLTVWQHWAEDVREQALDCGHFLAEETPVACATALRDFFDALASSPHLAFRE